MYWYLLSETGSDVAAESRASIGAKCGGMLVMFVLPFFFGLAPFKASKMKNAERYTKIASCFGGGVFLGTCFLHLIPEVTVLENIGLTLFHTSVHADKGGISTHKMTK